LINRGKARLLLESVLLGVVGALSAQLFMWMLRGCERIFLLGIAGYRPPGLSVSGSLPQLIGGHGLWLIPAVTTAGGLISGALVYGLAPEAEGHGTDTVVEAFHRSQGRLRTRVAPVKMVASAVTIGSGGSAGREGPIALIAAGLASIYATLTHRRDEERRLLLLTGMAAGLSAIFRSPLGTGVFAIEVLYGSMEFETEALLYTMTASAVAYTVNGAFVGFQPLFHVPQVKIPALSDYLWFAALGIVCGPVATLLPAVFYRTRDLFRRIPIPRWIKPGLGGLGVGLIALRLPEVLGGGYGWIQRAIDGHLALELLLVLVFAKMVAFALTVSSGGSGGVFAPSLFVGAMLGSAFSILFHQPAAVFTVLGMAAVFGAAARVPVATMLMVTEMAGGYHLLAAAALAVTISYSLQSKLSSFFRYRSLYQDQVPTALDSPAHYLDHIRSALNLLGRRNVPELQKLRHLDLLQLLKATVNFDLPGKKELTLGVLRDESPFVGRSIRDFYQELSGCEFEIVAIMRREHVLLPYPDTLFKAQDRVIVIASPARCEGLWHELRPPTPARSPIV
jgi:chloride channel protein, CIC family